VSSHTHLTAPTQYLEAAGIRFAHRRFGSADGAPPLVLLQHFTGTMDNWDPAVTDGLAAGREIVLFNNAGVSSTNGRAPSTIAEMAAHAAAFLDAAELGKVDLLGFSMGGMVAQQIALGRPELLRRLILVGTGPRGGEGMAALSPRAQAIFAAEYDPPDELWLQVMFGPSKSSQEAGSAFLYRIRQRQIDRDPPIDAAVPGAQLAAVAEWGADRGGDYSYLAAIEHETLVVNGHDDIVIPTINSYLLAKHLPYAQLILYPDSNHGAQYQFPETFVAHASRFLDN
jgi:pimeloyl-ACP methyl ester carboxylesterase